MRILFINSIFPNPVEPNKGNFIVKNIAAYPAEAEVTVIAPVPLFLGFRRGKKSVSIPHQDTIRCNGRQVSVHRPRFILFPRNILRVFIPLLEYLFILPSTIHIYSSWRFDLIHANFASPDGIAATLISKKLKVPLIITEHQASLEQLLAIPYLRKQMLTAYKHASRVICVSERTKQIVLNANPRQPNLVVIPNGVDFSRFQLRTKQPKPERLIYIGYLIPHKGVHVLLSALAQLKESGITPELSIVGSGAYLAELKRHCQQLALNEQVSFLGEKNALQVAQLLSEHDAMVHPSFIESFGIVLVEAMASGLPVVTTYNGGAESIVTPETGIMVPINDATALARGIVQLYANWDSYQPEAIRAYAQSRFSISIVADKTIETYKEVLCRQ
jgi:glycosyltransferase involved in cell wall biosynthesis